MEVSSRSAKYPFRTSTSVHSQFDVRAATHSSAVMPVTSTAEYVDSGEPVTDQARQRALETLECKGCLDNLGRAELEQFGQDSGPAARKSPWALGRHGAGREAAGGEDAHRKAAEAEGEQCVQKEFEKRRGQRNIVLKARQMGLTTWVAARFFLKTITQPGTLTLEVAHTQEAAEEIFRIVHRFVDWLPDGLRDGR